MGITLIQFCKECDPNMYLNLIYDPVVEPNNKLVQVKYILEHPDMFSGLGFYGPFKCYYTWLDYDLDSVVAVLKGHVW